MCLHDQTGRKETGLNMHMYRPQKELRSDPSVEYSHHLLVLPNHGAGLPQPLRLCPSSEALAGVFISWSGWFLAPTWSLDSVKDGLKDNRMGLCCLLLSLGQSLHVYISAFYCRKDTSVSFGAWLEVL